MKIWKRWSVWTAAAILSGTLVFPAAAQEQAEPEPKEELAQLLDGLRVPGSAAERALREELGLSELARNIKEKGIDASVKMFLTEDTMREMGLIQEGPEDNYGELYFQYSSAQKRWLFGEALPFQGKVWRTSPFMEMNTFSVLRFRSSMRELQPSAQEAFWTSIRIQLCRSFWERSLCPRIYRWPLYRGRKVLSRISSRNTRAGRERLRMRERDWRRISR